MTADYKEVDRMEKQKQQTKYWKLEKLVKWEHIDSVNEMLLRGISPHKVADWCEEKGFKISQAKLYEYKQLLQKSLARHITVERMLGIDAPKRHPVLLNVLGMESAKDFVKTELDVLDLIIQKGALALAADPSIRIQDALRAIELKNKVTGGAHAGFTNYGLEQLREIEQAKFEAILEVIKRYVPEDKHEELDWAITNAEKEYYENNAPELIEEWEKANQFSGEED